MKSRLVNNSDKSFEMLKARDHAVQAELTELQPQLVATVGEVEALMARVAAEKRDVVEPKAAVRSRACSVLLCDLRCVVEWCSGAEKRHVFRARDRGALCLVGVQVRLCSCVARVPVENPDIIEPKAAVRASRPRSEFLLCA
jgi:hypothetical protein